MRFDSLRWLTLVFATATASFIGGDSFANWSIEPVDTAGNSGWSLFVDVDSTGSPHAAFYTTNPNGDMRSAWRNGGAWQAGAVLDNADAYALDDNDDIFFVNVVAPDFHPHFNIQLDNGLVLQQKLASTRVSSEVFLDFDSQNRPQIGYVDTTARQLKHTFWNGASWTTRTVASGSEFQYGNSGFKATLDEADQIHFAWGNFDTGVIKYARPTATSWQVTTPFPTLNASPFDIDVDNDGNVHLAYNVTTGNVSTGGLFYSLYNGTIWNGGRVPGLLNFGAGRTSLVADETGTPHLFTYDSAFSGPEFLKHVFREDGAWKSETIDSYTSGVSGPDSIEARLDEFGYHVLYATGQQNIYYAHLAPQSSLQGDYNDDGFVDIADYTVWRNTRDQSITVGSGADGTGPAGVPDGVVDQLDYGLWKSHFGETMGGGAARSSSGLNVPEPATITLLFVAVLPTSFAGCRRRRASGARPS